MPNEMLNAHFVDVGDGGGGGEREGGRKGGTVDGENLVTTRERRKFQCRLRLRRHSRLTGQSHLHIRCRMAAYSSDVTEICDL